MKKIFAVLALVLTWYVYDKSVCPTPITYCTEMKPTVSAAGVITFRPDNGGIRTLRENWEMYQPMQSNGCPR
jgi:hypothetical protein